MAFHLGLVGGAVQSLERRLGVDGDLDGNILDERGAEFLGVERIHIFHQSTLVLEQLGVGDPDPLVRPRLDREDADLEGIAAHVFEQGRVFHLADDVLVKRAGFVGGQQLGLGHGAVDVHRELVDVRAGRQRKNVGAFEPGVVRIVKLLVDRGGGGQIVDFHADPVVVHGERGERKMAGGHERHRMEPRPVHWRADDDQTIRQGMIHGEATGNGDQGGEQRSFERLHGRIVPSIFPIVCKVSVKTIFE